LAVPLDRPGVVAVDSLRYRGNAVGVDAGLVQGLRWEVQGLSSLFCLESEAVQVTLEDSIVAIVEQT
jgi:hypothetical protein